MIVFIDDPHQGRRRCSPNLPSSIFSTNLCKKTLCLGVREGPLIIVFSKTNFQWCDCVWFMLYLAALASLEIIPLFTPGILSKLFQSINITQTAAIRSRFLTERFFQKSVHFHLFLKSHSDLFFPQLIDLFVFTLAVSFMARTFSPSTRSFPHLITLEELLN